MKLNPMSLITIFSSVNLIFTEKKIKYISLFILKGWCYYLWFIPSLAPRWNIYFFWRWMLFSWSRNKWSNITFQLHVVRPSTICFALHSRRKIEALFVMSDEVLEGVLENIGQCVGWRRVNLRDYLIITILIICSSTLITTIALS